MRSGYRCWVIAALAASGWTSQAAAGPVILEASSDNSIYQESQNSAGATENIFAGQTSLGTLRRALIQFDLSPIPAGSTITSAELTLHVTLASPTSGPREMTLHRLLAEWGEGTTVAPGAGGTGGPPTPGSATWIHRFYDTEQWSTPGGDFEPVASANAIVDDLGPYQWSSPGMVADVQFWLDNPTSHFGWMLRGDEGGPGTAKRFASREAITASIRPTLTVTFSSACYADCDGNNALTVDDFTCFINEFAAGSGTLNGCPGGNCYANCTGATTEPYLTVDDFTCFINAFAAGCP